MAQHPNGDIFHSQKAYIEKMKELNIDEVQTAADAAEVSAVLGEMMWVSTKLRYTVSWSCSRYISLNRRYKFDAGNMRLQDVELDKSMDSKELVKQIKKKVRMLKATPDYSLKFQRLNGPCVAVCFVD